LNVVTFIEKNFRLKIEKFTFKLLYLLIAPFLGRIFAVFNKIVPDLNQILLTVIPSFFQAFFLYEQWVNKA